MSRHKDNTASSLNKRTETTKNLYTKLHIPKLIFASSSMLFRKETVVLFEKALNIDANRSFGMCNLVHKFLLVSVHLF